MNRQGFTLVELLVTMAIIGILMAVILNFQSSTLRLSEQQNNVAQRLQTINDVSGYIGDRVKAARTVPDGLTVDASTCSRSAAAPCLAVVLPVVELYPLSGCTRPPGTIIDWTLHAYRYVARSTIPANQKTPLPGVDSIAYGLREIRVASGVSLSTSSSCRDARPTPPATFTGTTTSAIVVDNLVLPATGTQAFEYDSTKRTVTLRLRSVTASRTGTAQYTPATDPYVLTVYARNVN